MPVVTDLTDASVQYGCLAPGITQRGSPIPFAKGRSWHLWSLKGDTGREQNPNLGNAVAQALSLFCVDLAFGHFSTAANLGTNHLAFLRRKGEGSPGVRVVSGTRCVPSLLTHVSVEG